MHLKILQLSKIEIIKIYSEFYNQAEIFNSKDIMINNTI